MCNYWCIEVVSGGFLFIIFWGGRILQSGTGKGFRTGLWVLWMLCAFVVFFGVFFFCTGNFVKDQNNNGKSWWGNEGYIVFCTVFLHGLWLLLNIRTNLQQNILYQIKFVLANCCGIREMLLLEKNLFLLQRTDSMSRLLRGRRVPTTFSIAVC